MELTNIKKKKNKAINERQQKQYQNAKICHIHQVRELCYYTEEYRHAAHSQWNLEHSIPKEIYIIFQNGSNYVYDFIRKS